MRTILSVAAARAEPVESGSVELNLTSALAKKLKQEGVLLGALKPGQNGRAAESFATIPASPIQFNAGTGEAGASSLGTVSFTARTR